MGVQYSIREAVLTMEFVGVNEPQDVVRRFLEAMNDTACPRPVELLIDVSRSESLATRPAKEVRKVAEFLGPHADRIEDVGVAAQVFRTAAEALKWLGYPTVARR